MIFPISANYAIGFEGCQTFKNLLGHLRMKVKVKSLSHVQLFATMMDFLTVEELQQQRPPASV